MTQARNDISFVLESAGGPFDDPAFLVTPANSSESLLLDCGTLHPIRTRHLMKIRWLLLSHLHIDHLIGFDHLLRVRLFSDLPLSVFGPPGTIEILSHRLRGYAWNLTSGSPFVVDIHDLPLLPGQPVQRCRFTCHDSFLPSEPPQAVKHEGDVSLQSSVCFKWCPVKHGVPCLCFIVEQKFSPQFSLEDCRRLGLTPGPWVSQLTSGQPVYQEVGGEKRDRSWLSRHLLLDRLPQRLGYLTDTLLDQAMSAELTEFFKPLNLLLAETAYRNSEAESAHHNLHMTTSQVAHLAQACEAEALGIFHLSRRYAEEGPEQHLAEVRAIFPEARLLIDLNCCSSETPS